jgi:chemotaxis protein CheD
MESLINGLLKLGARRERLEVKLFGGGHILQTTIDVGERNIAFAHQWLATEGFHIAAEDVGDVVPRRVIYMAGSGKVRVKHLRAIESRDIATRERQYLKTTATAPVVSDIELF